MFSRSNSQAPSATQIGAVVASKVALAIVVEKIDRCQKNRSPANSSPESQTLRSSERHPLMSPLYGDLKGLPPLLLQCGSEEMLRDDSFRLAAKARAAGVNATFEEWDEMVHVWHLFADRLGDGRKALGHVGAFVRKHVGP